MSLLLSSCKTMDRNNMKPLETVNFVEINRYIGEWYEITGSSSNYVLDPWRVNTPEHSRTIYGKVLPIHIERNKERADGLAD